MPTRELRDQPPPTVRPDRSGPGPSGPDTTGPGTTGTSRDPVLIGEVLFHTLADLARRTAAPSLPAQRTRPHP
ncbi:hypothetical protein ACFV0O_39505 [Kitasatospora sp. NPDC059577]|uniref:hypothetical protein n=1 Tax=unclassified Kitasatospora TaxID=2633591 RepID=UPI0036889FD6